MAFQGRLTQSTNSDRLTKGLVGWWRIDPKTGSTLGMMGSSRGEGHLEYVIITSLIMVCAALAFASLVSKFELLADNMKICSSGHGRLARSRQPKISN